MHSRICLTHLLKQCSAKELTLAGHEVRLAAVAEHSGNLQLLQAYGGIMVEGVTSAGISPCFAQPAMMTTDVQAALRGAQVVMVIVPAFAQEPYMQSLRTPK